MGKRKAAKKPPGKKRNEPLATAFSCLFCNHEKSVTVKLDKKAGVGQLSCKVCDQKFQCGVNYLSAAVDVYSEWVDACDAVAKEGGAGDDLAPARQMGSGRGIDRDRERESDNDIIDDDDDGAGGYGGDGIVADDEY
ncbi:zinc beta-ribbon [Coleophoma crateriformis]|uniref:Transcription elongation factor 1 homolog n=1 Tax=Coleophoma crateriformis TaxID=565419 RepID=A0A3D8R8F6_9HELO|nr:zinc beta-ribbon [Coleophoma crateriformis]